MSATIQDLTHGLGSQPAGACGIVIVLLHTAWNELGNDILISKPLHARSDLKVTMSRLDGWEIKISVPREIASVRA